jgi:hypothetical protein
MTWFGRNKPAAERSKAEAEARCRARRGDLRVRCGAIVDDSLIDGRENLGLILETLRLSLACVDALERRVRELEKSKT